MSISERALEYSNYKGMKAVDFERISGLSNGMLKNLSDKTRHQTFVRISNAFPDLNIEWLRTGQGEMLNASPESKYVEQGRDFSLVPLINIDSVGGMDSSNSLTVSEQFIERMIPITGAREEDRAIFQSGDSMIPTIPPGSILHIRKVNGWQEYFGYGNVFVLWLMDDRRITKQVLRSSQDPMNYIICHSFNPDSADEELPKRFIREVWKVITVITDKGW